MKNRIILIALVLGTLISCQKETQKQNKNKIKEEGLVTKPNQIGKKTYDTFTNSWFLHCSNSEHFKFENILNDFCDLKELKDFVENSNLNESQKNFYTSISKKEWSENKLRNLYEIYKNIENLYCEDEFKFIDFTYERRNSQGMTYIDGELHLEHNGKKAFGKSIILLTTSILLNKEFKTTLIRFKKY